MSFSALINGELSGLGVQKCTLNDSVYLAKEIFKDNQPFSIRHDTSGEILYLDLHFRLTFREALSNDSMAKMNKLERDFFYEYVDYENGNITARMNVTLMKAIDIWLSNTVNGINYPGVNDAFNAAHSI